MNQTKEIEITGTRTKYFERKRQIKVYPPPQIGSSATPEAASAAPGATNDVAPAISSGNHVTASVAENVSSFLNGIRATFRQDNVYVSSRLTQKKSDAKNRSNDGGQI